ncbi:MAG: hypothetical protein R3D44_15125 [Hyphomicrobiaceae bacterium]
MKGFLSRAPNALAAGAVLAGLGLVYWMAQGSSDDLGLASFLARFVHIGAAMVWVGMIWFVNFIQLVALKEADAAGRNALLVHVVPKVTALFSMASHVVVASGGVLLLTTGYLFDRLVFPSSVYIPSARGLMLWLGAAGGLAMWGLVHGVIRPNLKTILDEGAAPASIGAARERVMLAARVNLVLAVPVTFAMVAAAHLY